MRCPPDPHVERIAAMLRAAGAETAAKAYIEKALLRASIAKAPAGDNAAS